MPEITVNMEEWTRTVNEDGSFTYSAPWLTSTMRVTVADETDIQGTIAGIIRAYLARHGEGNGISILHRE